MLTRAGLVGLGTGIVVSGVLFYPLYAVWPGLYVEGWPAASRLLGILLVVPAVALLVLGGGRAAARSGAARPGPRIALGALAGGLAALVLFCTLGATAAAGLAGLAPGPGPGPMSEGAAQGWSALETSLRITGWTHAAFWSLTLSGMALGAVGAALQAAVSVLPQRAQRETILALAGWHQLEGTGAAGPQMALNTTITALPSTALAVILVVGLFSHLPELVGKTGAAPTLSAQTLLDWPLGTALLLYLAAQLALTLVVPHEARQVKHRCAIDEVKMAAYVGIGVPLALALILGILNLPLVFTPPVLGSLLLSLGMLVRMIFVLFSLILPIWAQMPPPRDEWEAMFFGTIAHSRWQSLILLCLGCGIMIAAPVYVAVVAATLNLTFIPVFASRLGWDAAALGNGAPVDLVQRLYGVQAIAGLGSSLAAALALTAVYLLYLGLGKGFRRMRDAAPRLTP